RHTRFSRDWSSDVCSSDLVVVSRSTEMKLIDEDGNVRMTNNISYGSILKIAEGKKVSKGDVIASWDPYNGVIIAESAGKIEYEKIGRASCRERGEGSGGEI